MNAWLQYRDGSARRSFELGTADVVVGRHRDCDLVLASDAVSRRHAVLRWDEGAYWIHDLGSRNGTLLNGQRIGDPVALNDGDRIVLCDREIDFSVAAATDPLSVTMVDEPGVEPEILSTMNLAGTRPQVESIDPEAALQAVLRVQREIGRHTDLEQLLPSVLSSVFDLYPHAHHGVILLLDSDGVPQPAAVQSRSEEGAELQISRTVIARAIERREAILSTNAAEDEQFDTSVSLMRMPIRSLICAPLIGRDNTVLGLIELHTEAQDAVFTERCLDLLVSVGSSIAIAVENANLQRQAIQQDRLRRDLDYAKDVQRSFLPAGVPVEEGYRFTVHYQAADTVGGDYYNFMRLPGDRLAVALGDVSGKGMPAALMMARLSSDVRFALQQDQDPARALVLVNRSLIESGLEDRFVTFVLMVLDPGRHRVAVAIAGHQPPFLRGADGSVRKIKPARIGLPLNVIDDPEMAPETLEFDLGPGESVLAYTDGLSEAANAAGEEFGDARVGELFGAAGSPDDAVERLVAAVSKFASGLRHRDDTTIVAFGRTN